MAEGISQEEESFTCPICLDLLKDPVTIPCGHNYCMRCIKGCLDQEDQKGVYSCPLCKHTFTTRPVLYKNPLIAEMVVKFRKIRIQTAPHNYAGPGDVECDICTGRKLKSVKFCLECLVSYCETHYTVHNELNPGREHSVIDATDNHKGQDTVTAAAERTDKQQLGHSQRRFQQIIQEREKELQELRKAVETLKSSAQTAVEDSERIFTEMIRSIERRRSEVTELIRAQEKAEVSRAEGLLKQMEQDIAELKRRDAELEQLSHTKDHIRFFKNIQSLRQSPRWKDLHSETLSPSFEAVKESVSAVKVQLGAIFKQEVAKISAAVTHIQITRSLECTDPELPARRRTDRHNHLPPENCCHFTLDPNTADRNLYLSEGNRMVEWRYEPQSYPDHPERFDKWPKVLCREGVSGLSHWEVEWSGQVHIAVSYKSISRKGGLNDSGFGCNNQSWSLQLSSSRSLFWHNNRGTKLPLVASSRIRVYVDHRAGTLEFYSISDAMTLLHRVQTTFNHTVYPGFFLYPGSTVKLL